MDIEVIITAGVAVVVLVLGFIFEKERDRKAKLHERREDLYKNLIFKLKGFIDSTQDYKKYKEEFVDETRNARLYASDSAIKALNKLLDHLMKNEQNFKEVGGKTYQDIAHNLLGKFMIAMRKDLGIKTRLSAEELGRTEKINGRS